MTDPQEQPKRVRGRPRKFGRRQNFNFRLTDDLRERLIKSAEYWGRSLSEEIEFRINRDFGWEATKDDIDHMRARAAAWEEDSRIKAIRAAGLTILREIDGRPTRAVVELERLIATADGIARGLLGAGFVDDKGPPPLPTRPMTPEEEQRVLEELEQLKRGLQAAAADKPNKVA